MKLYLLEKNGDFKIVQACNVFEAGEKVDLFDYNFLEFDGEIKTIEEFIASCRDKDFAADCRGRVQYGKEYTGGSPEIIFN